MDQNTLFLNVELPEQLNLAYTQIIARPKELFLVDQMNSKMIFVTDDFKAYSIAIPIIEVPQMCYTASLNETQIIFFGGIEPYLFDKNNLAFTKYSYLETTKQKKHFRHISAELNRFNHNILFATEDCEQILYHNYFNTLNLDETDFYMETRKSEIGIYITEEEKKLPQFTSPEKITCVNWYTESNKWGDDYGPKTFSNIRGCLAGDKIVLCYHDMLYVLDYQGNVLQQRPPGEGLKYWDMTKMDEAHVIIAEAGDGDTMSLSVYEV